MGRVPGSISGVRYDDLRQAMPKVIQDQYLAEGTFAAICKVRFPVSARRDLVTVTLESGRVDRWEHASSGWTKR